MQYNKMSIKIWSLNTRLITANCECQIVGGTTLKDFQYNQSTLNKSNVKKMLLFCTRGQMTFIIPKIKKILSPESIIVIAKEYARFSVKNVFVSSVMVNTRRSSSFIIAVTKFLQDKSATHQFHFMGSSNTKRPLERRPSCQSVR